MRNPLNNLPTIPSSSLKGFNRELFKNILNNTTSDIYFSTGEQLFFKRFIWNY